MQEDLLKRITIDPEVCHGKPTIRGMRYPVDSILEYLAAGDTIEDIFTLAGVPAAAPLQGVVTCN